MEGLIRFIFFMSNILTIGERPNKQNIESLDLTQKVNLSGILRRNKNAKTVYVYPFVIQISYMFC